MTEKKKEHSEMHFRHLSKIYKIGDKYDFLDETGKWLIVAIKEIIENCLVVERKVFPDGKKEMAVGYGEINTRLKSFGSMCLQKGDQIELYSNGLKQWEKGTITNRLGDRIYMNTPTLHDHQIEFIEFGYMKPRLENYGSNFKP